VKAIYRFKVQGGAFGAVHGPAFKVGTLNLEPTRGVWHLPAILRYTPAKAL
jgi:hypothetical protein